MLREEAQSSQARCPWKGARKEAGAVGNANEGGARELGTEEQAEWLNPRLL